MFVYLYGNHNFKTFSFKKSVHSVMLGVALLKKASFKEFSNEEKRCHFGFYCLALWTAYKNYLTLLVILLECK